MNKPKKAIIITSVAVIFLISVIQLLNILLGIDIWEGTLGKLPNPIAWYKCHQQGGNYESFCLLSGCFNYACVFSYSDGGQPCTSSSQCQGQCLVTEDTILEVDYSHPIFPDGKVVGGYGECQYSNRPSGSFPPTIERPFEIQYD